MDTRFWGPAGWKLIHLIAHEPERTPKRNAAVAKWFALLPFVLPCKYCRASLTDYLKIQPLTPEIIRNSEQFSRWAYDLHNRVNAKLRGQGLLRDSGLDPSWESVKLMYDTLQSQLCPLHSFSSSLTKEKEKEKESAFPAWDFLIAVAFTTPGSDYKPNPMPDLPEGVTEKEQNNWCRIVRNRYNLLTREERINAMGEWWSLIPDVLPCSTWRESWSSALESNKTPLEKALWSGKEAMMKWIWQQESLMCKQLGCPPPHSSQTALCRAAELYESGCGKSKSRRAVTCRRLLRLQTRRRQKKFQ